MDPRRSTIRWDEATIAEHDLDRGTRQRISEPKTPFHAAAHSPASTPGGGDDPAFAAGGGLGGSGAGGGGLPGTACSSGSSSDGVTLSHPRLAAALAQGWDDGGAAAGACGGGETSGCRAACARRRRGRV